MLPSLHLVHNLLLSSLPKILLAFRTYTVLVRVLAISLCLHFSRDLSVLLILDRNVDLVSVLAHGWTYQALVSDCLEIKLNRVTVTQQQNKKSYDLDSKDFFWAQNAANPFPQVAEEIDAELNKYKQDAAEITRSTGVSDVNDISQLYVQCLDTQTFCSDTLRMIETSRLMPLI